MIPLKQTVYIVKKGGEDDWGIPLPGQEFPVPGRVDLMTKKVVASDGEEVVSSAKILLKGAQNITVEDEVKWTDALGNTYKRRPIQVNPLNDLNGKVLFTQVVI